MTFVGIDLGTMNTAGVTSHGIRRHLLSAVGWPKDLVARKLIGRDVLFGDDLIAHRKALQVMRPFEKGTLKFGPALSGEEGRVETQRRMAAATELLRHLRGSLEIPDGHPVCGVLGVPCDASLTNKATLLKIASDVFDQVLLIPEPFAIAYGLSPSAQALIVDIGAGTIDFCHYFGGLPEAADQVSLNWGGDHVDEDFHQRVCAAYPDLHFSLNSARLLKEKHGFVGSLVASVPVRLASKKHELVKVDLVRELRESCSLLAAEVVRGIRQLLAQVDATCHDSMLRNVVLGGGGSQLIGLDVVIEDMLAEYGAVRVTKLHDSLYAGANGALRLAMDLPAEGWEASRAQVVAVAADAKIGSHARAA